MRRTTLIIALVWTGALGVKREVAAQADRVPQIVAANKAAVVLVITYDANNKPLAQGSGCIVRSDGVIITNHHVVRNAQSITVKLSNGASFNAVGLLGQDEQVDLALVKVEGSELPTVKLGDSSAVKAGQAVVAIGSPFGLENSVSTGVIGGIRRLETGDVLLQITTPISQGSSGAPLFNMAGQVVGIVRGTIPDGQNLNFAVPVNNIRLLLSRPQTLQPFTPPKPSELSKEQTQAHLLELYKSKDPALQTAAIAGLATYSDPKFTPLFIDALKSEPPFNNSPLRLPAIRALEQVADEKAVSALLETHFIGEDYEAALALKDVIYRLTIEDTERGLRALDVIAAALRERKGEHYVVSNTKIVDITFAHIAQRSEGYEFYNRSMRRNKALRDDEIKMFDEKVQAISDRAYRILVDLFHEQRGGGISDFWDMFRKRPAAQYLAGLTAFVTPLDYLSPYTLNPEVEEARAYLGMKRISGSLKGIKAIDIWVVISKQAEDLGVTHDGVQEQVFVSLKSKLPGVTIQNLTFSDYLKKIRKDSRPTLSVELLIAGDAGYLDVQVTQSCLSGASIELWSGGVLFAGLTPSQFTQKVKEVIDDQMTKFAADYHRQNQ